MYFSYFSQSQSFSFQAEDSERRVVELGWENFVDNVKNCWENYEGDLKSRVDDWKNYWNDGSDLHGLTVDGHYFVGSMRNLGDFSSEDCTLVRKDHCSTLKRPHHGLRILLLSLKHRILLKHMILDLTVSRARS